MSLCFMYSYIYGIYHKTALFRQQRVKKGPSDAFSPIRNDWAIRLPLRSRGLKGVETLASQG